MDISNIILGQEMKCQFDYLDEFSDPSVVISGDNITLSKENNKVSYYNYNNTQTFENRFELKFTKDGGDYTCTKVECK